MPGSSAHLLKRQLGATYIAFRDGLRFSRSRPSRDNFNPHPRTFSITDRVRRRHQRFPSYLVIENPRQPGLLFDSTCLAADFR